MEILSETKFIHSSRTHRLLAYSHVATTTVTFEYKFIINAAPSSLTATETLTYSFLSKIEIHTSNSQ